MPEFTALATHRFDSMARPRGKRDQPVLYWLKYDAVRFPTRGRIGTKSIKSQCAAREALRLVEEIINCADEPILALPLVSRPATRSERDVDVRREMRTLTIGVEFKLDRARLRAIIPRGSHDLRQPCE